MEKWVLDWLTRVQSIFNKCPSLVSGEYQHIQQPITEIYYELGTGSYTYNFESLEYTPNTSCPNSGISYKVGANYPSFV